jgi:hypothetical protein
MTRPLMPKATALWLINHTRLTLEQIAHFCGFHPLELSVLQEGKTIQELSPLVNGQLTQEEIARCEADPKAHLTLMLQEEIKKGTRKKYTPLAKRNEVPNAVLWIIRTMPEVSDAQICSLLSTTKTTVKAIREGIHWNFKNLTPKDPLSLELCSQESLLAILPDLEPKNPL